MYSYKFLINDVKPVHSRYPLNDERLPGKLQVPNCSVFDLTGDQTTGPHHLELTLYSLGHRGSYLLEKLMTEQ